MKRSPELIAGLTLLAVVALVVCVPLGVDAVRLLLTRFHPGVTLVLAIDSAHPYHAGLAAAEARRGTLESLRARLDPLTPDAIFHSDGDRVEVTLPSDVDPDRASRQLTRSGRLEFMVVDDGTDYMRQLAEFAVDSGIAYRDDDWTDTKGARHSDRYIHGPDRAAMADAVRRFSTPLASDHAIVFERIQDENGQREWRSYYVFARSELDGQSITTADLLLDRQTNRPEVAIELSSAGAAAFEATTARAVGRKLAIMLEGVVNSAPVIESKIASGRVRITLGGSTDPAAAKQSGLDLISILRAGTMPAPVTLLEMRVPKR